MPKEFKTAEKEAAEFVARLVKLYKRFLQLQPERKIRFLEFFEQLENAIEDETLLEIFKEIEIIFKSEVEDEK